MDNKPNCTERPLWADKHYSFFKNSDCEFFPCHVGVPADSFNCLFCYCPLYALGEKCGGSFRYLESGVKDCSGCIFPHQKENYGLVTARFAEIARLASKK